ncbi:G-type lectin S-receptor-like serine/threonine-protein kinase RKS1 [Quercus lobata]|uniref:G-type lectin S-receptor-like serine/threonine-protein kinase RKS1 n=1 Tax=Quercus lobata TaxID=97700 RepID=UPI001244B5E0|nr:G-type lectin S-receptor-like serine/threonine-protein kinase RKS1 [Quercus lobata]
MNPAKSLLKSVLILPLSLLFPICVSLDTITPDQPIKDGQTLVSNQKTFTLGFFSPGNSNRRYVGIWYYQITEQTIVWVANRDNPLNDSSGILSINSHGNLVLHTQNQTLPIWSTNIASVSSTNYSISMAPLLDVGNLVLVQQHSQRFLWQSFDYPTNTILPFMKLGLDRQTGLSQYLTSWKSKDDPKTGKYSYKIDPIGYPQLLLYKGQTPLWRAGSWSGQGLTGVPEMKSKLYNSDVNVSFVNNKDGITIMYSITEPDIYSKIIFVLGESGTFGRYTWGDGKWVRFWFNPKESCDIYLSCGPNSYCDPYKGEEFDCTCLPGFKPKSPLDWSIRDGSSGCVRNQGVSTCKSGEGFIKLACVKVPDTSIAHVDMSLSLKECEQECLRNCSCMAYTSADESEEGIGCLTWHGDLVDIRTFSNEGQDLYIRVDSIVLAQYAKKNGIARKTRIACSLPNLEDSTSRRDLDGTRTDSNLPVFDLKNIIAATDNFSVANLLGKGGFGSVYKGLLQNGMEIAVKRLSKNSRQGIEQFKNEVVLIAKLQHRNLVRILGCCVQGEEKMLIYEYLPNNSLDSYIFDGTKSSWLDWGKRIEIICGIPRGILYLHQDSRLRIIHRDLKASNVLLDTALNPKISDFGMARIFGGDQIEANTNCVVGTFGYMSPEYAMQGLFSIKSDVFSFGVLLLEIITGKRNTNYYHNGPSSNLIGHIWDQWKEGKAMQIVDPSQGETYPANEVSRCIQIGLLCVQEHATDRPTMSAVVFMLSNDTPLPSPKQPAFIFKSASNTNDQTTIEGANSINEITITKIDVLLLLLSLLFPICVSLDTITLDQPIKDGQTLVSNQKTFALGFFSPGNSNRRYVGIWYYQITEQTIVWVANRHNPLNDSSGILSINSHGNLVLHTQNQTLPIWSTNIASVSSTNYSISMVQLLDVGNLVLVQQHSQRVLWQSFDYPTNTILPFMKVGLDRQTGLSRYLTSWKSQDDPKIGKYSFKLDPIGCPQLLLYKGRTPLWRGGTWSNQGLAGVPEMKSKLYISLMNVSFVNNQDEITIMYSIIEPNDYSKIIFVLGESGTLGMYTWDNGKWVKLCYPKESCDIYLKCGPNSYCDPYNGDEFDCVCLPGFEPKSPLDWHIRDGSSGCVRNQGVSTCKSEEGFVKLASVKVPDTSIAHVDMSLSLKECEQECLRNCSCTAYTSADESEEGIGCLTWHGDLVDIRTFSNEGQDLYIRVDSVVLGNTLNSYESSACRVPSLEDSTSRRNHDGTGRDSNLPVFDLKNIIAATNNFSVANLLGKGGFGSVYKGLLKNGMEIAVKKLSKNSRQGIEQFKNEVVLIAKLQHRNLVRILGCCAQGEEKMLIYEYLPNNSLDSYIFDETKRSWLDWGKRIEIICGIARGILYLHQDSRLRIIHRDLKASNVLLDIALNPKISDFGMARIFRGDQIEANTNCVVGTLGYMSPKYAMQGLFSIKSDVFSFGVLLLEIITGKRNTNYNHNGPSSNLIGHIWDQWKEGKAMEIVDPSLGETYPANEVLRCIQIGLLCVQDHATNRPAMSAVVFMLSSDTPLPSPKQPAFIFKSTCNTKGQTTIEGANSINEITITKIDGR